MATGSGVGVAKVAGTILPADKEGVVGKLRLVKKFIIPALKGDFSEDKAHALFKVADVKDTADFACWPSAPTEVEVFTPEVDTTLEEALDGLGVPREALMLEWQHIGHVVDKASDSLAIGNGVSLFVGDGKIICLYRPNADDINAKEYPANYPPKLRVKAGHKIFVVAQNQG